MRGSTQLIDVCPYYVNAGHCEVFIYGVLLVGVSEGHYVVKEGASVWGSPYCEGRCECRGVTIL